MELSIHRKGGHYGCKVNFERTDLKIKQYLQSLDNKANNLFINPFIYSVLKLLLNKFNVNGLMSTSEKLMNHHQGMDKRNIRYCSNIIHHYKKLDYE